MPRNAHSTASRRDTAAPPKIEVHGLTKRFRRPDDTELLVLNGLDLEVETNEFLCILGASGCGKTTLLRIIGGLDSASGGEVRIGGKLSRGPSPDKAIVFQQDAVFPWMTVAGNIEFPLRNRGVPRVERKRLVRHYLELVSLEDFADAFPLQLSGGMRKRVDLARVYAAGPDVLLMDEPFSALDAITKNVMHGALLDIWEREQKTVLFITHDLEEAAFLGDRVLVLGHRGTGVLTEVRVPFSRPRHTDIKLTAEFTDVKQELWKHIQESMEQANGESSAG